MTASSPSRRWIVLALALGCAGCRAKGLPEPPPGADPADPDAKIPAWRPADDPLVRSAFGPEDSVGATGHEGHGPHHHHHAPAPAPTPDAAPDDAPAEHEGHDTAEPSSR